MRPIHLIALLGILAGALIIAGCLQSPLKGAPEVRLVYTDASRMQQLLMTNQIDGFIIWQPVVETVNSSGAGKIIAYSQYIPPDRIWADHTCCALEARQDIIQKNPGLANAISALTILSIQYINEHPDRAAEITADWLFGQKDIIAGTRVLRPVDIETKALSTVKFTTEPTDAWVRSNDRFVQTYIELDQLKGQLKYSTSEQAHTILFDFEPYRNARQMVDAKKIVPPPKESRTIGFGYLPSDHDAPLFVAAKDWQYFSSHYGIALRPKDATKIKPDMFDLIINNETVAEIRAVEGQGGAGLMKLMDQDEIQFAYAGTPPAIVAIDSGIPIKILHPINTEGSGLVVGVDAPCNDWQSFIQWAKDRAVAYRPLQIATVKGSIQEVIFRFAMKDAGIPVNVVSP
jgi:NitT/TauT family transport system substrate-binding protein